MKFIFIGLVALSTLSAFAGECKIGNTKDLPMESKVLLTEMGVQLFDAEIVGKNIVINTTTSSKITGISDFIDSMSSYSKTREKTRFTTEVRLEIEGAVVALGVGEASVTIDEIHQMQDRAERQYARYNKAADKSIVKGVHALVTSSNVCL